MSEISDLQFSQFQ